MLHIDFLQQQQLLHATQTLLSIIHTQLGNLLEADNRMVNLSCAHLRPIQLSICEQRQVSQWLHCLSLQDELF